VLPFGYCRDEAGAFVIDSTEADLVRRMFAWLADGTSIRGIVRRANASGVPPRRGGQWRASSVGRMLANAAYTGRAWYNRRVNRPGQARGMRPEGEWIAIDVPALVSQPTFERAQRALARNRDILAGHPGHRTYLLKGLLICWCGRRLRGEASHGVRFYRRSERDALRTTGDPRRTRSLRADTIEPPVWDAVVAVLRDPDLLVAKVKAARLGLDAQRVEADTEAGDLRRALAAVRAKRERLLKLYLAGTFGADDAVYTKQEGELQRQEADTANRLAAVEATAASAEATAMQHAAVARNCALIVRGLNRLDAEGQARLLRLLVDRIALDERDGALHADAHGLLPGSAAVVGEGGTDGGNCPDRYDDRAAREAGSQGGNVLQPCSPVAR
jgi:hypothetical protein